jgi:serine/threonine protein phosphatase 1
MNDTPGHTMLFSALRHAAFTEERGVLFVHAAVDPTRPLLAQGDAFWWGSEDILLFDEPFQGFCRVVRGADRKRRGLVEGEFAVSLDGGAGHGGPLLAACFGAHGNLLDVIEA